MDRVETERTDVLGRRFRADGTIWRVEAIARNRGTPVALLLCEEAGRMREVAVEALVSDGAYRMLDGAEE